SRWRPHAEEPFRLQAGKGRACVGYVYAARRHLADLLEAMGDPAGAAEQRHQQRGNKCAWTVEADAGPQPEVRLGPRAVAQAPAS
ncbi:MAG TPA: hypothetical protein VIK93_09250, partial [Limnochordales bacterium]